MRAFPSSLLLLSLLGSAAARAGTGECPTQVVVNGRCAERATLEQIQQRYRFQVQPGRYWYDRASGLAGLDGQAPIGFFAPNMPFDAPLAADASRGRTRVFINGREITDSEVAFLRTLGPVIPGRYWLDAAGNVGFEGRPTPFANLVALAQATQRGNARGGSRDNFHGNSYLHTYSNSAGGCGYVSTPAGTVMTGNCN
jgi:hypothetical protein